jgi:hypothetical protein
MIRCAVVEVSDESDDKVNRYRYRKWLADVQHISSKLHSIVKMRTTNAVKTMERITLKRIFIGKNSQVANIKRVKRTRQYVKWNIVRIRSSHETNFEQDSITKTRRGFVIREDLSLSLAR